MDVDLYVSARDGRFPVTEDYDFKSDNTGPDDVFISSSDPFWSNVGYNKTIGVIFVVGVKALTDNANFTLVMIGPNKLEVPFTALTPGVQYVRTLPGTSAPAIQNIQYFRWFNWGFKDFRINLDVSLG